MQTQQFVVDVAVPSIEEFTARYPQYAPFARDAGRALFEMLTAPSAYLRARIATEDLELPAVAGVARAAHDWVRAQQVVTWDTFVKQFIGAVVCASMEANGFSKTGTKRAIPHYAFTKGEFYRRA